MDIMNREGISSKTFPRRAVRGIESRKDDQTNKQTALHFHFFLSTVSATEGKTHTPNDNFSLCRFITSILCTD